MYADRLANRTSSREDTGENKAKKEKGREVITVEREKETR